MWGQYDRNDGACDADIVEIRILCFEFIGVIVIIISGAKGFWNYVRREPEMKITLAQGLADRAGI